MIATSSIAKKEKGRLVHNGMGGFLNPPGHPEHDFSIETDLRRRPENRGGMSLSSAATCEWLDSSTRMTAKAKLRSWQAPAIDSPEIVAWIRQVLGYFKGCYSGQTKDGAQSWNVFDLRIMPDADPVLNQDIHAGVHMIREYYPAFVATSDDFANAKWGS